MTEVQAKKGMSKGLLIALIVVGVVVLLVVIAGITCYLKREELVRYGAVISINSVKTEVNDNPVEGVDTVRVNAVADAFVEKLQESKLDFDKCGRFVRTVQAIMSDKKVDSDEAEDIVQAMIEYFPELEEMAPIEYLEDSTVTEDSLSIQ